MSPKPPPCFIAVTSFSLINLCLSGKVSAKAHVDTLGKETSSNVTSISFSKP